MKRHFSSRGEALAEVTTARMLVGRQRQPKSAIISQADRRYKRKQPWFCSPRISLVGQRPKAT